MIVAYIDDERVVFNSDSINEYAGLTLVDTEGGEEFYLAEDTEQAGEEAREYWKDMADNDPQEFTHMVGEQCLIAWALGTYAGPGSTQVSSLSEWLDLWLDTPEDHFASYDNIEREFKCKHPEWSDFTVAYRCN